MRPRVLKRRLALTAAALAVLAGTGTLYAAQVHAAPSICGELRADPRIGTVVMLIGALVEDGWTPAESWQIVVDTVAAGCPDQAQVLRRSVDEFAPEPVQVPLSGGVGGAVR